MHYEAPVIYAPNKIYQKQGGILASGKAKITKLKKENIKEYEQLKFIGNVKLDVWNSCRIFKGLMLTVNGKKMRMIFAIHPRIFLTKKFTNATFLNNFLEGVSRHISNSGSFNRIEYVYRKTNNGFIVHNYINGFNAEDMKFGYPHHGIVSIEK
ncbi:MAG: hypothetical protein EVG15_02695 [Candidatus Acididesulfobacter diazotrophicus]|jgi:hypothetical protein|uniref:Uncharacterized protein n=1 Tax=Candidatus Acididesulfobacter diazotrophicus TaxID=2597226 RepID=A0A519BP85_9DELT|nr:MAG: hypothetical protein EVG15_02695 [Candidatus Acididesulfobacter diazotrophicus]